MKKFILFSAMCVFGMLSATAQVDVWDGTHTTWTQGNGTQNNPYLIQTAEQLAHLAYVVNNGIGSGSGRIVGANTYYKLTTDIDLNGSEAFQWTPIGCYGNNYYAFGGHFDGDGHTISNLYINSTSSFLRGVGLFGYADGGSIKGIGILGNGKVVSNGTQWGGQDLFIGSIVGYAANVEIAHCYNTIDISSTLSMHGYSCTGGIIGYCTTSSISNCYNTGSISSTGKLMSALERTTLYVGGIVGNSTSEISNCYNIGNSSYTYVRNSPLEPYTQSGDAIVGRSMQHFQDSATVSNCYYLNFSGAGSGESKTEVYMKSPEFILALNHNNPFAYAQDIAPFVNDGYPILPNLKSVALAATNITRTAATLNGYLRQGTAALSDKGFQYKLSNQTTYTSVSVSSQTDTLTYQLSTLESGKTYHFRTFAANATGDTVVSDTLSFTTLSFNSNANNQYLIQTKEDLLLLAELVDGGNSFAGDTFLLTNDIILPNTPNNIRSIGKYDADPLAHRPFSGTFDGNNFRLVNVYIDQPNTPYQGFFGYGKNASIHNLGLVNITASGRNYTAGMVAYAENTDIRNSYVSGGTLFALSYCGGLVAYQTPGTNSIISGCYNTCTVTGNNYVGGLLGYSNEGTVRNSYVAALVTGQGQGVGAIIGGARDVLNYNCFFNDSITGQSYAIGENNVSQPIHKDGEGNMNSLSMRMQQFVMTLNQGLSVPVWKSDYNPPLNNGFPILIWQTPIGSTAIETTEVNGIAIYPNPTRDNITIALPDNVLNAVFILYDLQGRELLSQDINNGEQISVGGLSAGMYMYSLVVDGKRQQGKLSIVR